MSTEVCAPTGIASVSPQSTVAYRRAYVRSVGAGGNEMNGATPRVREEQARDRQDITAFGIARWSLAHFLPPSSSFLWQK